MEKQKKQIKIQGVPIHCSFDEIVKIADLKPNPENPNIHPDEQIILLAEMIRGNGWRDRITVSNQSGMIVKGHGRYLAAIKAGLKKAPVDFQDYDSEDHERADMVGDNKIAELSFLDEKAILNLTENMNLGVFEGSKILEVKNIGVSKGRAAERWLTRKKWSFILAAGDDYTDEDMFSVLPQNAYSIKVGHGISKARFNLDSVQDLRLLLEELIKNQ